MGRPDIRKTQDFQGVSTDCSIEFTIGSSNRTKPKYMISFLAKRKTIVFGKCLQGKFYIFNPKDMQK